jgi:hypothetical protein
MAMVERERPPPINADLVQEFVRCAHGKLDRVMAMVEEHPALIKATWDWGGGDWESGMGAAAHVGRRDIAEYLLSKGAHMDIFAAAMLGHLDVVKAIISTVPEARSWRGAHGIPLLRHAEAGGEPAAAVVAYLKGAGPGA